MTKNKNLALLKAIALSLIICLCFSLIFIYAEENNEIETEELTPSEESSEGESSDVPATTPDESESSDDSSDEPKTEPEELTGISFSRENYNVFVGNTVTLTVLAEPDGAVLPEGITFSSDNEAVATVSSEGVVTAVSVGEAKITATIADTDYTCECTVTVKEEPSAEGSFDRMQKESTGEWFITGFKPGTSADKAREEMEAEFGTANVTIRNAGGDTLTGNITTGCVVEADGTKYIVIIFGDVNSDGLINKEDVTRLVRSLVDPAVRLSDAEKMAAGVVKGSDGITIQNAYVIQRHVAEIQPIEQKF